jgi:hypothetical protein
MQEVGKGRERAAKNAVSLAKLESGHRMASM